MSDLVAFLMARIADDEQWAQETAGDEAHQRWALELSGDLNEGALVDCARRTLADVAAKRRLIDALGPIHEAETGIRYGHERYVACSCGWDRVLQDRERHDWEDRYEEHLRDEGGLRLRRPSLPARARSAVRRPSRVRPRMEADDVSDDLRL